MPNCYLCGARGSRLYINQPDRLFGAPGRWNINLCPAAACGLAWLDPRPIEEDIGNAYLNYFTHEDVPIPVGRLARFGQAAKAAYRAQRFGCGDSFHSRTARIVAAAPIYFSRLLRESIDVPLKYFAGHTGRILEVGCGNGDLLKIAAAMGWQAEGLEVDSQAVANARRKNLVVHWGRLNDQQLPAESFDLILLADVLEHVHDPLGLIRECRRLLGSDGLLLISTPNLESWGHRRLGAKWMGLDPPRHLVIFNPRTITSLLRAAGFFSIKLRTTSRHTSFFFRISSALGDATDCAATRPVALRRRLYGYAAAYTELEITRLMRLGGSELLVEARNE